MFFRDILNKQRNGYGLQLKQLKENELLYGKNKRGEKMKKKFAGVIKIDENLSDNDNDVNEEQVNDNPESCSIYGMTNISYSGKQLISDIISSNQ